MNKNVIIGLLVIITILSLMYAFVKNAEARIFQAEVSKLERMGNQHKDIATEARREIERIMKENELQKEQLKECLNKPRHK